MLGERIIGLWRDIRGGIGVYSALGGAVLAGFGALSMDVGRIGLLQSQMQNAADAAALSAVRHLDGRPGARARARAVIEQGVSNISGVPNGSGDLIVESVTFYEEYGATMVEATNDKDAKYASVTLVPQTMPLSFRPILNRLSKSNNSNQTAVHASASASVTPIICHTPPFMVCNPAEADPTAVDVLSTAAIGTQVVLHEGGGGGSFAPGNYGTLCLPDGSCGASAVGGGLAAVEPQVCTDQNVETAPGAMTQKVRNGMNARLDEGSVSQKNPARNVINYPRDAGMVEGDLYGDGSWDADTYWNEKHNGEALPVALTGASRYQAYLYELGETFGRSGKETIYPVKTDLPDEYSLVAPVAEDVPVAPTPNLRNDPDYDGVPQSTPVQDPKRRVVKAAVLNCVEQNVQGSHEYSTNGNYVEIFITEVVDAPPNSVIYGEVVGAMNSGSDDYYANVWLLD